MEALIKVTEQDGKQVVSARELYEFLELGTNNWARWYRSNITGTKFAMEGVDYEEIFIKKETKPTKDFVLTLDFAKRISMMTRTEKGEVARQYFLDCEKQLEQVKTAIQKPMSPAELGLYHAQLLVAQEQRLNSVETDVRELKAARQTRPDYYTVVGYGTLHNVRNIGVKLASSIGKKAKALCRQQGYEIDTIPDPRFGKVNMYPREVLEKAFEEMALT